MKLFLIVGIIVFGVIGFLIFLWFISREQVKAPITKVKEEEKKDLDFIKQRQALYGGNKSEVQKIESLNVTNRGALFERAIERKRNQYRNDDEEYERRLEEKRSKQEHQQEGEQLQGEAEFKQVKHPLSSFIKSTPQEKQEVESINSEKEFDKEEFKQEQEDKIDETKSEKESVEDTNKGISKTETPLPEGRTLRVETLEDFGQRKLKVETKEKEKLLAFQKFKDEILLEAKNLKQRRKEFLASSNALYGNS